MHLESQKTKSFDELSIRYDVYGVGLIALVFVHGWCCNRRYWDEQIPPFSKNFTVVRLDLGGHGESGRNRQIYSMHSFALDVEAVIKRLKLQSVLLIGHSMGGAVVAKAALRLKKTLVGVVGVDTWSGLAKLRSKGEVSKAISPFQQDFATAMRNSVRNMFTARSKLALVTEITGRMTCVDPRIAISALREYQSYDATLRKDLRIIVTPKCAINASNRLTVGTADNYGITLIRMPGCGHFPMIEEPKTFNHILKRVIATFGGN